jgi:electron transfer flavoprotein alpha subunit
LEDVDAGRDAIWRGANVTYLCQGEGLKDFQPRAWAKAFAQLISEEKPEIVLAAATTTGRTLMPLVAARIGTGLTADCTELAIDAQDRLLLQTRPAIGGNVMATIKTPLAKPQMATVRPKSTSPNPVDLERTGEVVVKRFRALANLPLEIFLERVKDLTQEVNLQDAEVVVAGGKGLKSRENFRLVEELAGLLSAGVGATRDVVDLGWVSYPHQIGLSGKTVLPRLYVAIGLSGSVQHLAGMQSAETVVAINKDKDAQIFKVADFGIVGDLFDVVPELIAKIRAFRGQVASGER